MLEILATLPDEVRHIIYTPMGSIASHASKVALLWPDIFSPMKVVYFVNKYSVVVDAVLAVACASHVRSTVTVKFSHCALL